MQSQMHFEWLENRAAGKSNQTFYLLPQLLPLLYGTAQRYADLRCRFEDPFQGVSGLDMLFQIWCMLLPRSAPFLDDLPLSPVDLWDTVLSSAEDIPQYSNT